MIRLRLRAAGTALLAAGLVSCATNPEERLPETGATVEGTITYGGVPVQFARVVLSNGKQSAGGSVDADGRYKVVSAPLGPVTAAVDTAAAQGDFIGASRAAGSYQGAKGKKKVEVKFIEVPAKFADPKTSDLKTTVNPGANTFDIVIPK